MYSLCPPAITIGTRLRSVNVSNAFPFPLFLLLTSKPPVQRFSRKENKRCASLLVLIIARLTHPCYRLKLGPGRTGQFKSLEGAWSGESLQGDRKGPHPAPHRPRPYNEDERGVTRQVSL